MLLRSRAVLSLPRACEAAQDGPSAIVVLVSHGDALQLLQTAFQGSPAGVHRSLPHLNPAELRELVPTPAGVDLLRAPESS
mmetsp:Transcript_101209/g.326136  ORF Transcript_101209/g.326136 Transcript_101209/m.326136 type:complete len:81 (-) Transcript_101209:64-306(-)